MDTTVASEVSDSYWETRLWERKETVEGTEVGRASRPRGRSETWKQTEILEEKAAEAVQFWENLSQAEREFPSISGPLEEPHIRQGWLGSGPPLYSVLWVAHGRHVCGVNAWKSKSTSAEAHESTVLFAHSKLSWKLSEWHNDMVT